MKPLVFRILLLVLIAGNTAGAYRLFTERAAFLDQFPKLSETSYQYFRFLPLVNIIGLLGMWFWRRWGAWLAVAGGIVVIGCDIWLGIWYHLSVAIPSLLILLFFIIRYAKQFK